MDAPRLRSLLLRGSVVAAANWPVVLAQAIAESVVKALAGIPVAGAALLIVLPSFPNALPSVGPIRDGAAALTALATMPAALAGVAVSALVAALGSIVFGAVIKAGTVAVVVSGEARARAMAVGPLRVADLLAAQAWSRSRFMDGCARFGPRFVRLALVLAVAEGAIALGYATAVVQAYRGFVSMAASWWIAPAVVAVSAIALIASIAAELVYRIAQLALVMEDRSIGDAVRGAIAFVRRDALVVVRISVAAVLLSTLAFVVTLIAAAAFGLVSFVPVAGVAVLPLQAAVWVVRGLMLPFIELAALAAYAAVYRRGATPMATPVAMPGPGPLPGSLPGSLPESLPAPSDRLARPAAEPPTPAAAPDSARRFPA